MIETRRQQIMAQRIKVAEGLTAERNTNNPVADQRLKVMLNLALAAAQGLTLWQDANASFAIFSSGGSLRQRAKT